MYVYSYIRIYVCVYVCICVHKRIHVRMHKSIFMYVRRPIMYVCMCTNDCKGITIG